MKPLVSKRAKPFRRSLGSVALAACLVIPTMVAGQTYHWTGSLGELWSIGQNWSGGMQPNGAYSTILDFGVAGATLNDLGPFRLQSESFTADMAQSGHALSFAGGGAILDSATGNSSIDNAIGINGNQANQNYLNVSISSGATLTMSGTISGTGSLNMSGSGVLNLSGANSYSGGTQVSGVTVVLGSALSLGTGSLTLGAGSVDLNGFDVAVTNLTLGQGGGGSIGVVTSGTVSLSGNLIYNGSAALGTLPATLDSYLTIDFGNGTHYINSMSGPAFGTGVSLILGSLLEGTGSINFENTSGKSGYIVALLNSNTYTGSTTISSNTEVIDDATNALPTGTALIVNGTLSLTNSIAQSGVTEGTYNQTIASLSGLGVINLGGATLTVGGDNTNSNFFGEITGDGGTLDKVGTGTLVLAGGKGNNYGVTDIMGGTVSLAGSYALGGSDVWLVGGTLQTNGFNDNVNNLTFGGSNAPVVGSIEGGGTLTVSKDIRYDGNFMGASEGATISANLVLTQGNHNFLDNGSSGQSQYEISFLGDISGAGGLTLEIDSGACLFGADANFSGGLTIYKGAKLNLGVANSLDSTGSVSVGGVLELSNGGSGFDQSIGTLSGSGSVFLNGATLTIGSGNGDGTFSGQIIGASGTLDKIGTGNLHLSGVDTNVDYTISSGSITLGASNVLGGGNVLLTGGTLNLNSSSDTVNNLTFGDASTTTPGTLSGGGSLTLNGNLLYQANFAGIGTAEVVAANLVLGTGNHTVGTNGNHTTSSADLTLSGAISGAGSLEFVGSGANLAIGGTNNYTGSTTVDPGVTLFLTGPNALPSGTALTDNGAIDFGLGTYYSQTVASLKGSGTINLGPATLSVGGDNSNSTFVGPILGYGGTLTKLGTGTLTIANSQDDYGITTILGGTLTLAANDALGGADVLLVDGTLNTAGFTDRLLNLSFGDGVSATPGNVTGGGTLEVSRDIRYNGNASDTSSGANLGTGLFLDSGTHSVTDNGFIGDSKYEITFAGGIGGYGGLELDGTGASYRFSGVGTYTAGTTISNGVTLDLGIASALPSSDTLTDNGVLDLGDGAGGFNQNIGGLVGTGTINLDGATISVGNDNSSTTFAGTFSGSGTLLKVGTGTLDLTGTTTAATSVEVSAGTLEATAKSAGGSVQIDPTGIFEIIQTSTGTLAGALSGTGEFLKAGSGTLNMNDQSFGGTTIVSAGALDLNGTSLESDGGVVISAAGRVRLESIDAGLSGGALQNFGQISGSGTVNNGFVNETSGQVSLSATDYLEFSGASNTNNGVIRLGGGTIQFDNGLTNSSTGFISGRGTIVGTPSTPGGYSLMNYGSMGFSGSETDVYGDLENLGSGTIVNAGGGVLTFYGNVEQNGGAIKTDGGSYTVFFGNEGGAGNFTGTGTVEFDGNLHPGNSPDIVHYGGDVVLGDESVTQMLIVGALPGTGYDQMIVAGDTYLDGTLDVTLGKGYVPYANEQFDLIVGNTIGSFATLDLPTLSGLQWGYTEGANGFILTTHPLATPEPMSLLVLAVGAAGLLRRRSRRSKIRA